MRSGVRTLFFALLTLIALVYVDSSRADPVPVLSEKRPSLIAADDTTRYAQVRKAYEEGAYGTVIKEASAVTASWDKTASTDGASVPDAQTQARWYRLLGRAHQYRGEHDAAVTALERAFERSGHISTALRLGESYTQQARYEEARDLYRTVEKKDDTRRVVQVQLARLALRARDWFEAADRYGALVETDTTNGLWQARWARSLEGMGRSEAALSAWRSAHRLRPQDADIALQLSARLRQLGASGEAVRVVDRSLSTRPAHAPLWRRRADLAFERTALDSARAAYEQALAYGDSSATVYRRLGIVHAGAGRHADAVAVLRRSLGRDSSSTRTRLYLGISYRHLDSLDRSAAVLREMIDRIADRQITDGYVELARTEDARERLPDALTAYRMARRLQPQRTEPLFRIAQLYDRYYRDKSVAARYYRRFLEADGADAFPQLQTYARRRLDALVPILHMSASPKP